MAVSSVSPGLVNTALFRYALPDLHTDVSTGAVDDDAKLDKLYQVQGYFMTPAAKAAQTPRRRRSRCTCERANSVRWWCCRRC